MFFHPFHRRGRRSQDRFFLVAGALPCALNISFPSLTGVAVYSSILSTDGVVDLRTDSSLCAGTLSLAAHIILPSLAGVAVCSPILATHRIIQGKADLP